MLGYGYIDELIFQERAEKKKKIEHLEEQVSKARQECSRLRQQLQVEFSVSLTLHIFFFYNLYPSGVHQNKMH